MRIVVDWVWVRLCLCWNGICRGFLGSDGHDWSVLVSINGFDASNVSVGLL